MNSDTPTFSPPQSHRTFEGSPYCLTASRKPFSNVEARRYTGNLEYPSIPPCMTTRYLINLCYLSISHKLFDMQTLYCLQWRARLNCASIPLGSILMRLSLTLERWILRPIPLRNPATDLTPELGWVSTNCLVMTSGSSSVISLTIASFLFKPILENSPSDCSWTNSQRICYVTILLVNWSSSSAASWFSLRPYLFDVLFHRHFPPRKWVGRLAKK